MGFFTRTFLPPKLYRALNPWQSAKYSARRHYLPRPVQKALHISAAVRNPFGYAKRRASYSLSERIRRTIWK
ncbi:hypothetical protein VVR12_08120 [Rothia sp. LK2588]|uniref:hypothetical protein n=1 Tax=Rothia sp. LK2588 TaxID=3114369 RepID=UPI0034D012E4